MAQRLWPDTYRHAVPADHDSINREFGDTEFLVEDHVRRDNNHNSLRPVASAGSEFEQHGAGNTWDVLKLKQNDWIRVENFRRVGVQRSNGADLLPRN